MEIFNISQHLANFSENVIIQTYNLSSVMFNVIPYF